MYKKPEATSVLCFFKVPNSVGFIGKFAFFFGVKSMRSYLPILFFKFLNKMLGTFSHVLNGFYPSIDTFAHSSFVLRMTYFLYANMRTLCCTVRE